jgi:hypothetical protein
MLLSEEGKAWTFVAAIRMLSSAGAEESPEYEAEILRRDFDDEPNWKPLGD